MKATFAETLGDVLPEAVSTAVKSETESLTKKLGDVESQMTALANQVKFGAGDETKELHAKTAKFFKTLVKRSPDFAEAKAAFLNEGTDGEGGELVPTEFAREVLRVAKEVGFARRYCRIIPMSTDKKDISKIINGVTVYWTAEGVAYTGSKPTTGMVSLVCNKLTALVSGTNELIDDNQTDTEVFNLVRDLIAEAMAEFEDAQVLTGTGTAPQMPGIFHASTSIPSKVIATGHNTIAEVDYKDLVAIKNALPMKYRKNGGKICWTMHQDVYTVIEGLVDLQGRPLLKESIKRDSDETLLLGYPIEVVSAAPNTEGASVKFIAFGNFNYYLFGDRMGLAFELGYATGGFETDVQSMKASERIAGKVAFTDAFVVGVTAAA